MAYARRSYRKKRVSKRKRVHRKTSTRRSYRKTSKAFSSRVRRVVARLAETKSTTLNWTNYIQPAVVQGTANTNGLSQNILALNPTLPLGAPGGNLPTGSCQAGPYLGQGYQVDDRLGNKVRTKKAIFKATINQNQYNATTFPIPQPIYVKMYLVKNKQSPLTPPTQAQLGGVNGTFFRLGALTAGFNGSAQDVTQDVNPDDWTLLATKMFKIGPASYTGAGSAGSFEYFSNNDFKLCHMLKWDVTKYLPKQVNFDDIGNSTNPTTWMIIQTVPADQSTALNAAALPLQVQYQYNYQFTDV
nr:MAG: capsid protein [Cressdnaviricota sp.]